jgi:phosphoglucosamine mutase
MLRSGYSVGGEQSGHIILLDHATTGDGILSALRLLHALNNQQMRLKEASQIMTVLPQVLKKAHVSNGDKPRVMQDEMIQNEIEQIRETLADRGRVLVRPSGTEPIIRVMIEGEDIGAIEQMADHLSSVITKRFNS